MGARETKRLKDKSKRAKGLATQSFSMTFSRETMVWVNETAPRFGLNRSAFVERAVMQWREDIESLESLGLSHERVNCLFAGMEILKSMGLKAVAKSKAFAQLTM